MQKPPWLPLLTSAARLAGAGLLAVGCWSLWLALAVVLVLQVVIAVNGEFQVPRFVLRAFEDRLAVSRIQTRFGRALLDPTGGLLLENLQLSLPEFAEPVISARAVYVELDPWPLLAGRVEAHRVHATGVNVMIPAMLATSGRAEPGIDELEFDVVSSGRQLDVRYLTTRMAGVRLAVHGTLRLPAPKATRAASPVPVLENLAAHYAATSRQLVRVSQRLRGVEAPRLQAGLTPLPGGGAHAVLELTTPAASVPEWGGIAVHDLRLQAEGDLGTAQSVPVTLAATAAAARIGDVEATALQARTQGRLNVTQMAFQPDHLALVIDRGGARGFALDRLLAELELGALPRVAGRALLEYGGAPLFVTGEADLASRTARLNVDGQLSPILLTPLSTRLGRDLRRFVDFRRPVEVRLAARFGTPWRFTSLAGHVAARDIDAYNVHLDRGGGDIVFDGRNFVARHAYAALGENFARGSFEQDLGTRQFRFLLNGRLRPLDISPWFRDWWPEFFERFQFPDAPPDASVDVAGRWKSGEETTVFLYAQCGRPVIREAQLDYARTLMFIRPNFYDAFELFGTRGAGELRGHFTLQREVGRSLQETGRLGFALESTLDLATGGRLLGPALASWVEPFSFDSAPQVTASGDFEARPTDTAGWHRAIAISTRSSGGFTAFGFPGRDLGFDAKIADDEVLIERLEAGVASGQIAGHLRIWGPAADRRLGFDAYLKNASLGEAITAVENYTAHRQGGRPAASADRFLTGTDHVRLDVALSADGPLAQPYRFRGSGNASIAGNELGQIRLLGLLSQLINFTALRFTAARGDFKLEGDKIIFPSLNVTGANSAIHAHGDYSLERHALDFNARVYPFEESKGFIQSVVGAVLTPFSAVFEVRLTGALDQPKWAFVIGPTNLFNSLTPQPAAPPAPPATSEPISTQEPSKSADHSTKSN